MTTEDKLRELILSEYKSVREFTKAIEMPYTTMDSILHRGVGNSSVTNIIKICRKLRISIEALADGKIVHYYEMKKIYDEVDATDIVEAAKRELLKNNITLDGNPIKTKNAQLIADAMEIGLEIARKRN